MKLLETSYLVDYERGREPTRAYYEANRHEEFTASTITMFELGFGVVWESDRSLDELRKSLLWVDFLSFTLQDALTAAQIQAELQAAGTRIPIGDILIAGVARNRGATLVASDDHFEQIEGFVVDNYQNIA